MLARFEADAPLATRRLVAVARRRGARRAAVGRTIALDDAFVRHLLARRALDRRIASFSCRPQPAGGERRRSPPPSAPCVPLAPRVARGRARRCLLSSPPSAARPAPARANITAAAGSRCRRGSRGRTRRSGGVRRPCWRAGPPLGGRPRWTAARCRGRTRARHDGASAPLTFAPETAVRLASGARCGRCRTSSRTRARAASPARAARAAGATRAPGARRAGVAVCLTLAEVEDAMVSPACARWPSAVRARDRPGSVDAAERGGRPALAGMAQRIQAAYRSVCESRSTMTIAASSGRSAITSATATSCSVTWASRPAAPRLRPERPLRRAAGHGQDDGRRRARARARASSSTRSTSPAVVSKYIGETEKNLERVFDGRRDAATRSSSSTRPTRSSASARR